MLPEQAAERVCAAIIDHPERLATPLGVLRSWWNCSPPMPADHYRAKVTECSRLRGGLRRARRRRADDAGDRRFCPRSRAGFIGSLTVGGARRLLAHQLAPENLAYLLLGSVWRNSRNFGRLSRSTAY